MNLTNLDYPRHLHKPDGTHCRVENADEAQAKIAEGWELLPTGAEYGVTRKDGTVEPGTVPQADRPSSPLKEKGPIGRPR